MKLVVGLGNPGDKYLNTRHNIGFSVIKRLVEIYKIDLTYKQKYKSLLGVETIYGSRIIFAMPQTYMNLSGTAIYEITAFFKILAADMIVIHDDIDINLGKIKIKYGSSSGGHNGIKNIIEYLKTENFNRIRIGIGPKPDLLNLNDYVLGKFNNDEQILIGESINKTCEAVDFILKYGVAIAMNKFNGR